MTSKRHTTDTVIRYAIGASVLLLGLMAFSALCWFTCSLCGIESMLSSIGFWELVGAGAISFFAVTIIRSMRRRRKVDDVEMEDVPEPDSDPDQDMSAPSRRERISSNLRDHRDNWRALYAQLSRDEREKLKEIVEKYCADDVPHTPTSSHPDDGKLHSS
jgi:hypothetical protein